MKKITLLLIAGLSNMLMAQNNQQAWKSIEEKNIPASGERVIVPKKYKTVELLEDNLKNVLFSAPHENNVKLAASPLIIFLPVPDGSLQQFRVVESPVMAPELAAQFPTIKTFNVKGIDDPQASGKLDWTEFGFHGMVRSVNGGDFFIDPYCRNTQAYYISYYTADFKKDESNMLPESDPINNSNSTQKINADVNTIQAVCIGGNLRTYSLAVACTGEYAVAATGLGSPSVAQTLSCIVTTVNRVDGVYETEVAVKLVLVATETSVVFTSAGSDPFNGNNNASTLINESQTVIDANIGNANYDIGHTFSTGGGGLAQLGCVCQTGNKASGITGSPSPAGDPYDIDYVAHEIGHQFDGNHTFRATSGSCNGNQNPGTMVEPGSGITIMAYAGICGVNNDSTNSIAYFHAISYDEIVAFTQTGTGNGCATTTASGNNSPAVTGSANYSIPKSTPFTLTGSATDPDGDVVSYQWEEVDNNSTAGNWNSGSKPFFRSYNPVSIPTRMFPKLSVVLSGNMTGTIGEYLPGTAQNLKFRLTARDNQMGGGGVCSAPTVSVTVTSSGPFNVSSPNTTGISYNDGSVQTITWNVGGTTASPISCANVDIYLSLDGGTTWQLLVAATPNDGSEAITLPYVNGINPNCRIKIVCPSNIFFDINDANFTIMGTLGANEYSSSNTLGLQLIPNPFTNFVELNAFGLDAGEKTTVTIFDVIGNVVKSEQISSMQNIVLKYDLSALSNGVYIIQLSNGQNRSIARMVKQ
ncbi:MAG: T9SS type A sorting domain-containing protein [Bacteroidia bacterium]|nr:T9SS type A sorting domain-containing protein [Bacteroidia bacterium]